MLPYNYPHPDDQSEGGSSETDDRAGDDYVPHRIDGRFSKVNGTERNNIMDSEDLDRNGTLDRVNSYFRYAIDLFSQPVLDVREQYPDYQGFHEAFNERDSWRWYRIELAAGIAVTSAAAPDLSSVRHIRIWFRDTDIVVHSDDAFGRGRLQIAKFRFTD